MSQTRREVGHLASSLIKEHVFCAEKVQVDKIGQFLLLPTYPLFFASLFKYIYNFPYIIENKSGLWPKIVPQK